MRIIGKFYAYSICEKSEGRNKTRERLRNYFVYQGDIYVEPAQSERSVFREILSRSEVGDTMLVDRWESLGTTKADILHNYRQIYEKGAGLLFPVECGSLHQYSTADYSLRGITISREFEDLYEVVRGCLLD